MLRTCSSRTLLCTNASFDVKEVRQLLELAGHEVIEHSFEQPDPDDLSGYHLIVMGSSGTDGAALQFGQRVRKKLAERFLPVLLISDESAPSALLTDMDKSVDAFLVRPFSPGELHAQVRALLRIKDLHDHLAAKSAETTQIHQRLQQAYQQINQELELARRLQLSFLPQSFPPVPECRFAVHYRLRGQVGGDFYDVFRLDESHIGLYVADVVGHGVAASLLTMFIKKGVQAKDIFNQHYRLVPPNEVLERLNRDLVGQELSGSPFITMVYALLNHRNGTIEFARAGHPHPLYMPRKGEPRLWKVDGPLLGVFETRFTVQTNQLSPGDKLLFYSDGIDAAQYADQPEGIESLLAFVAEYRALPVQELMDQIVQELFHAVQPDDLTLLGLEMCAVE